MSIKETPKKRPGRPKHIPTDENRAIVSALAGYGAPHEYIGRQIGVGGDVLRRDYRFELDDGTHNANATVAESLYKKAIGDDKGSVTAAIFWLKTRAGFKETSVTEIKDDTGSWREKLRREAE